ncbi:FAD dependent oxidoreductase [Desulforapulum autotrophicum HRM2]|uniref:FAD dependent oxidoreductase n=1 Tax=Desulforapulum autotrophicum (strain ATCC 43914 / DSM 3382 / VKM B-1955 / HRM2) TaxID=177437 RepID=C0QAX3_DESAH|nr:FAD-binding oxidoreductase [Desulforapulum autotrophicum]ACN16906.1 FAD dependent oxidoreductase [Desulforapulum autotrophicum HRM2]
MSNTYDVIIIGGGIMGSSTAYHLMKADKTLKVVVVEKDATYAKASTTLSMVNTRIQYSLKENIQISQHAENVLENFEDEMEVNGVRPNIVYKREGNLVILDAKAEASARKAYEMQKELGCAIEWWSPEKIKEVYPLYNMDGVVGGTFGPKDGHFDAYAVLMGYKAKARALGAQYMENEVVDLITADKAIQGVKLASGETLISSTVVNCTGAWAAKLCKKAGITIPVDPTKRQCFAVDPAIKPATALPLTFIPSGLYFRTETGGLILLGKSLPEDPVGFDFSWDQKRFLENLWIELAEFVPAFESLKLVRGWAGLYAVNTQDANSILGEWPELKGFYLVNGFSGHGLQQGPAVGRYITELITKTKPVLDLSIFGPQRIINNTPIMEGGIY